VSQTAAAEVVRAGEAELPFALVGYANGVQEEPTPVERLRADRAGPPAFARLLAAVSRIDEVALAPAGIIDRFGERLAQWVGGRRSDEHADPPRAAARRGARPPRGVRVRPAGLPRL
jgi:aminoglycoside phosphotransferase (APT) family kinase protein